MLWSKWHEHTEILTSLLCIDWLSQPRPFDMLPVVILIHSDLVWWIRRKKSNIRVLRERSRTAWVSLSSLPRINHFFQDERKWQTTQKTFLSSAKKGKTFFLHCSAIFNFLLFLLFLGSLFPVGCINALEMIFRNLKRATSRPSSLSEDGKLLSSFAVANAKKFASPEGLSSLKQSSNLFFRFHSISNRVWCYQPRLLLRFSLHVVLPPQHIKVNNRCCVCRCVLNLIFFLPFFFGCEGVEHVKLGRGGMGKN